MLLAREVHVERRDAERAIEELVGRELREPEPAAGRRDERGGREAGGDVAGTVAAHAVEDRVEAEVRIDEDDVLVHVANLADVGPTGAAGGTP